MAYLKPQSPLKNFQTGDYIYPLTTADQVVMEDGSRLNSVFKHTVKTTVTLLATNWNETAPYMQTIVLQESAEDLSVDANIIYSGDKDTVLALNKAASCLSYIKKEGQNIIFYCLEKKPEIDIPVEIIYSSLNNIANINIEEGVKLDFDVVTYATEEELLAATPAENTIGVITTTPISNWVFSVDQPETPAEGMVWISTGMHSTAEFNALKKNGIQVYPISATQYISGAWVDVTAKSYQGGSWVEWVTWLYNAGNEYTDLTGGWDGSGYYYGNSGVTKNADSITLAAAYGSYRSNIGTVNKINLQGKRYLKATGYANAANNAAMVILTSKDDTADSTFSSAAYFPTTETEIFIPLDALQGEYYIAFVSKTTTAYIKSVKLV